MQAVRVVDAFMMSHCQLTTQQDMWLASAFGVWWSLFHNVTTFQSNTSNYQATSEIFWELIILQLYVCTLNTRFLLCTVVVAV